MLFICIIHMKQKDVEFPCDDKFMMEFLEIWNYRIEFRRKIANDISVNGSHLY